MKPLYCCIVTSLEVYALHERAVHVYEKVGFEHEALLRDAVFKFGEWQDVLVMAKVRDDLDV